MIDYTDSISLPHTGDCRFLGVDPAMVIYVEEIFGDDDTLSQHAITLADGIIDSTGGDDFVPLALPQPLVRPTPVRAARWLNFRGPRHRGLRDPERITDVVRALEVPTRIKLVQQLQLDIAPPFLIGIAESQVMAEALLQAPDTYIVCRRLRIAYALEQPKRDAQNQLYDYDTLEIYAAHLYNAADGEVDLPPETVFAGLPGVQLLRPMDCMVYNQHLLVADGGKDDQPDRIHIWRID